MNHLVRSFFENPVLRKNLILSFFIFGMFTVLNRNVLAENCLNTWHPDNSRNMLANLGFEDTPDFDGWNRLSERPGVETRIDDTNSHTGRRSFKVTWEGSLTDNAYNQNYYHTYQTVNVKPGVTYRLSGYIKTDNIYSEIQGVAKWNGVRIVVVDPINGRKYFHVKTKSLYGTNDWKRVVLKLTIPEKTTKINITLRRFVGRQSGKSYGTAWWDDIQLIPVPKIDKVSASKSGIIIYGQSFGDDPGLGNRANEENCVLYNGVCMSESLIRSWSDSTIVVNNVRDGTLMVKSGGVVSDIVPIRQKFKLSNNTISINFPNIAIGEGIDLITDIRTGRQFLNDSITPPPLYEFTVKDNPFTKRKIVYSSKDASTISRTYTNKDGLQTLTITANHCEGFIVTITITLPSTIGGAKFSINIQNSSQKTIKSVRYPFIAAKPKLGNDSTDDAIVIPYFEGYLLKNPAAVSATTKYKDIEYPGPMTVQMMAYYDSEQPDAGLYLSMDDSKGHKKRFGFERIKKGALDCILFSFLHSISESPGNQLSLSYHVNIDTFIGNWYTAADRYKQWASTQPWTTTKLVDRNDIPRWFYNIQAMIDCYSCRPNHYVGLVRSYKNILEVSNMLLYPGGYWGYKPVTWSGIDHFADNPIYSESEASSLPHKELKAAIDNLRSQGTDVLLFVEGLLWDQYCYKLSKNHKSFNKCTLLNQDTEIPDVIKLFDDRDDYYTYGRSYAVVNENGNIKYRNRGEDKYCQLATIMCVGNDNDSVMDLVLYNNIKRGIDHGARLMALDALVSGNIEGCWNPDHGHPIGEGKWAHDRFTSILNNINKIIGDKGRYGDFGFAMENQHELYMPYLQFQYIRHSDLDPRGGNKKIPLFNYIYKEYYIGIERGMSLGGKNDLDIRWSLAMDFIQGNIQGTMVSISHPNRNLINFYKRLIRMKRPEFYKGKMLHPPVFKGLPGETAIVRRGTNFLIDPVVTNVLKTDDNTISYLLVNANLDGSGSYDIQFDVTPYDLPSNKVNLMIVKNGKEIDYKQNVFLPVPVKVTLDGGDVIEVRIKYGEMSRERISLFH